MGSEITVLFVNLLTYHIADLCKFTYHHSLFENALFEKTRKSLKFL